MAEPLENIRLEMSGRREVVISPAEVSVGIPSQARAGAFCRDRRKEWRGPSLRATRRNPDYAAAADRKSGLRRFARNDGVSRA